MAFALGVWGRGLKSGYLKEGYKKDEDTPLCGAASWYRTVLVHSNTDGCAMFYTKYKQRSYMKRKAGEFSVSAVDFV